ncbi:lisH domain-containing protein FOPNL isoform X2 [Sarcophilus harrisii]|uniref:lisH domain-containing protein FOPNL isoform X2 n=1 Tax=Sarcophilus harrisii TaxID=9305 RepID=UPI00062B8C44|nr:lisH domain-containing protein FOPNL isoform X2 [Sarcophilus harrisii]
MATVSELKAVLKDTLEKRGVLGQLRATIRAEVFNALDDQGEKPPPLSHENLLINELIREYLEFNKYNYSASVLTAESGQPVMPLDRQFLIKELNIYEDSNAKSVWLPNHFHERIFTAASKVKSGRQAAQFKKKTKTMKCVFR